MNKFSIFIICLSLIYVTEAGIRCSLGQWACDASCAGTLRSHGICDDDGECICQAPVSITNLSRCNLGEDACNVFCTATGHVNGTCEEEENGSLDCECKGPKRRSPRDLTQPKSNRHLYDVDTLIDEIFNGDK